MHEALPAHTDTLTIDGYRRLPDEGMPSELVRGRVVAVHDPTGHSERRGEQDTLTEDSLFPGFRLELVELFRP